MATPNGYHRPNYRNKHWRGATLYTQHARVPLLWTPDPQHSPVLRMLRSGDEVMVVPEVKYGHWVITRVEHQVGWLNLNYVQLVEKEDPTETARAETPPTPPPTPPQREEETLAARPKNFDARLLEREQAAESSTDVAAELQHELDEMEKLPQQIDQQAPDDDSISLPKNDVKRLIGYLRGIRGILSNHNDE